MLCTVAGQASRTYKPFKRVKYDVLVCRCCFRRKSREALQYAVTPCVPVASVFQSRISCLAIMLPFPPPLSAHYSCDHIDMRSHQCDQ